MKIPEGKTIYPISASQKVLRWCELFSLEPRKVKENNVITGYFRVADGCNAEALERAFNELIKRSDALRLRLFRSVSGIRQYIVDYAYTQLLHISVNASTGFSEYLAQLPRARITFFSDNLVWAQLVILAPGDCALVLRIHHAAADGYSIRLIFERLQQYYDCFCRGVTPDEEPDCSIVKYFEQQRYYLQSPQHTLDRKFWFRQYTRQRKFSYPAGYRSEFGDCASEKITVKQQTYQKLVWLSERAGCTLQFLLMTLAAVTTYAVTGRKNFCIVSLTHGRLNRYLKNTIGCMMNTVPMFYDLNENATVEALLSPCYIAFLKALSHGRLPLGEQVPMSYPEAVRHFFNFNPSWLMFSCMEYGELFAHSTYEMQMIRSNNQPYQFYLTMLDVPGERIDFELSYQTHKYGKETARKLLNAYSSVIDMTAEDPQYSLVQIKKTYEKGESIDDDTECHTVGYGKNPRIGTIGDAGLS